MEGVVGSLAGTGRQGNLALEGWILCRLLDALCHVLSGEVEAEAEVGWGGSPPSAGHQGQHIGVKATSNGKKK